MTHDNGQNGLAPAVGRLNAKRERGQFYTVANPFEHEAFRKWAQEAGLPDACVLEPFAGGNSLIKHLSDIGLCNDYQSFDITPNAPEVRARDTLKSFPTGYDVCVTNPPWLARNSATARGLEYPFTVHDDIYKFSLEKCLDHCGYIAALIPESFIRARLFQDRLQAFVSLTAQLFSETTHPVGLALFVPNVCDDVVVYSGARKIGTLARIEACRPKPTYKRNIVFNAPDGNLGLIALDNTKGPSIRFCDVNELAGYEVKNHGRHITKLHVSGQLMIDKYNTFIGEFREKTGDVLLTCYRGLRKDGKYRRRLDWQLARGIIEAGV